MKFSVTILGSNSAIPAYNRHPTSQIIHHYNQRYLIDCGEGTQFRMTQHRVKRSNLNHIFISHLHGDHYFGLIGLINSLRLSGRKDELTIYGPPKLKDILLIQGNFEEEDWGFKITFQSLNHGKSDMIYENEVLEVFTIPLQHKNMICNGFLFREKQKPRKIIGEKIKKLAIPYAEIEAIRKGKDFINSDGEIFKNKELTTDGVKSKSYAFCSDTIFDKTIVPIIKKVDLLYHEATFMNAEEQKATERWHTTGRQAAQIAKLAEVKKLIIGHFSARYFDLQPLLLEAKEMFRHTELAEEGRVFEV